MTPYITRYLIHKSSVLSLIWVLGLGTLVFELPAQTLIKPIGIPFINHYTKKDYRGGTQNWDFCQTSNGMLYVANNQGVMIFDGLDWEVIPLPNGSVVRSLYLDENGRVFAGGFNEFGYLAPDSLNRIQFVSLAADAGNPEMGEVWRILSSNGEVYFQSYSAIQCWNSANRTWKEIRPDSRFDYLQMIAGELIINQVGKGLFTIDQAELFPVPGGEFFNDKEVWDILGYGKDWLVCTQNDGVFLYHQGDVTTWDTEVNEFLKNNRYYCSVQDQNSIFWGSILDGLVVSDQSGNVIRHINRDVGLPNNTVLSLYPDREGTLWLGLDNGIAQLLTNIPLSELATAQDIGSGYAAALFGDRIYLGTNQGLFWVNNFLGGKPGQELLSLQPVKELTGQVWSLDVFGEVMLVGHNQGTYAINTVGVSQPGVDPGGWKYVPIPGSNELVIGGTYYGLELFRIEGSQVISLGKVGNFNESCRQILFENEQVLWMGHGYEGIYRIELSDDYLKADKVTLFDHSSGLGTKTFNELLTVSPAVIVSNPSGYFQYDHETDDFVAADQWMKSFMAGGRMTRMIREDEEVYWFFQERGAGKLRIINDTLMVRDDQVLAPLEGSFIPSFENASFLGKENLIIGTDEGFVHLDPSRPAHYQSNYTVLIRNLTLLKTDSLIHLPLSDVSQDTLLTPEIPYRFNDIRIHYVAPNLTFPLQTEYRYWLEGESLQWSDWTGRSQAEYIGLREGKYYFHVEARNIFGTIARSAHLELVIKTPWYRSVVAYLAYLLVMLAAGFLGWFLVNKKLEREKRRAQLLEQRRMLHKQLKLRRDSELAEKEIVKLRNEKLRADVRHKSKELANQTMGIIQKNKFLTDIKDEMARLKNQAQNEEVRSSLRRMVRKIDRNIEDEDSLRIFETNFDQVHENFLSRLREAYPQLTSKDLRLCAYLRLNLSSKEIAPLLNISIRGVEISRYRLRKKLDLDHREHLADFILRF